MVQSLRMIRYLKRNYILFLMAVPALLCHLLFDYAPMFGVILAFKNYNFTQGFFGSPFVGLKNFEFLFSTTDAWIITRNTILYNVVFIILNTTLSILLAVLLSEILSRRLAKWLQTVLMMPYFLSAIVVAIVVYAFLRSENGFLNSVLAMFGMSAVDWYHTPSAWPFILVIVNAWKGVGYGAVLYLASISGIPNEYYEAAVLDGATKIQQARHITLPFIRQMVIILLILSIGGIFRSDCGLFYNVPQDIGTLYPVTNVIDTYVLRALIKLNNTGMSTAAGLYQSVVGFFLILLSNYIVKKVDPDSAMF